MPILRAQELITLSVHRILVTIVLWEEEGTIHTCNMDGPALGIYAAGFHFTDGGHPSTLLSESLSKGQSCPPGGKQQSHLGSHR